jgi:hypothetical protein
MKVGEENGKYNEEGTREDFFKTSGKTFIRNARASFSLTDLSYKTLPGIVLCL